MMTTGYAVKNSDGEILVRTVCETERGAMVNWLYTYAGVPIGQVKDEIVIAAFNQCANHHKVILVPVNIMEAVHAKHDAVPADG